jgi:serine/threonine-protein kinase HSL1 (negative regulator of Swe1 kinase)
MAGVGPGPPRAPLGDATRRVNNSAPTMSLKPPNVHGSEAVLHRPQPLPPPPPGPSRQRHRVSAIRERTEFESKRASQISQDSATSGRSKEGYKRFVGPWQLGKTLGKGSSARVRLCRHRYTQQSAAVKIVNKRMAYMIPDTSLAALNKWDSGLPEKIDGELRVPMAIEREVAILKLIDHPNIMKLYDIWENRSEM